MTRSPLRALAVVVAFTPAAATAVLVARGTLQVPAGVPLLLLQLALGFAAVSSDAFVHRLGIASLMLVGAIAILTDHTSAGDPAAAAAKPIGLLDVVAAIGSSVLRRALDRRAQLPR